MPRKKLNLPKQRLIDGPASIWKRLAAFIADLLIINIVIGFSFQDLLTRLIPKDLSIAEMSNYLATHPEVSKHLTTISVFIGVMALIYFSVMELKLGQTIGKMFFNINVVSEAKELKYWQCIVRSLFLIPIMPFMLLWVVDPLYVMFNKEGRRLTEILSKSKVVEKYAIR